MPLRKLQRGRARRKSKRKSNPDPSKQTSSAVPLGHRITVQGVTGPAILWDQDGIPIPPTPQPGWTAEEQKSFYELVGTQIKWDVRQFHQTGNPVYAFQTLWLADYYRLPLPPLVLRWLSWATKRWQRSRGKASLDELLCLRGARQGRRPAHKKWLLNERNSILCAELAELHMLDLGDLRSGSGPDCLSIEEAAEMICGRREGDERLQQFYSPELNPHWQLNPDTLVRIYKKWPHRAEQETLDRASSASWKRSTEEKRQHLTHYPRHTIPLRFRR